MQSLVETAVGAFAPACAACDATTTTGDCGADCVVVAPSSGSTATTGTGTGTGTGAAAKGPKVIAWRNVLETWTVSLAMGAAFGYLAERSLLGNPSTIRAQLLFANFPMIKMFMSAVGTSSVVFAALHYVFPEDFNKARAARGFGDKGLVTMVVGGALQGVGMALSGACPGMTMVQLGAGVPNASYTFVGGILGALAYGWMHPAVSERHVQDFRQTFKRLPSGNLDEVVRARTFGGVALPLGLGMVGLAVALDQFVKPWAADASSIPGARTPATGLVSPVLAGVGTGLLQLPAFLVLQTFLGSSSAYSVVASQYLRVAPDDHAARFAYMRSFLHSKAGWQTWYLAGAALGGALAARGMLDGHASPALPVPVPAAHALLGGFLTVLGARVAGGCATGHGLTGLSVLGVGGWTAVPAMFAAAVATAVGLASWGGQGVDGFLLRA